MKYYDKHKKTNYIEMILKNLMQPNELWIKGM